MRFKDNSGQTLIELIAAAFVLAVGLVGVLGLTTANVRNQTSGNIRLAGSQLAREGVELARNIRDTNWLQGKSWDEGLKSQNAVFACALINESMSQFRFIECEEQLYNKSLAIYRLGEKLAQIQNPPQEAVATGYYRIIRFAPICVNKTEQDFIDGNISGLIESIREKGEACENVKIGVRVTSQVGWRNALGTQETKVVEHLYNWK